MTIRERKDRPGTWVVDFGVVDGRRKCVSFRSLAAAEDCAAKAVVDGTRSALSADRVRAVIALEDRLERVGASLEDAANFYLAHAGIGAGSMVAVPVPLVEMIRQCLVSKYNEGMDRGYVSQLRSVGSLLAGAVGSGAMAHEVTAEMVEGWLRAGYAAGGANGGGGVVPYAAKTWNNYLTDIGSIYEWAIEAGMAVINPAKGLKRKRIVQDEVARLSVGECARLLVRCARPARVGRWKGVDFSGLLPYAVLGLFCGVRPGELAKLDWAQVNLEDGLIFVTHKGAKSRRRRVIELSDNAVAWLELVPVEDRVGKIGMRAHDYHWRRLKRACGFGVTLQGESAAEVAAMGRQWRVWPNDVVRHTFASMHIAEHQDEKRLQLLMGHRSSDVLHDHYRGVVTRAEAGRFWRLRPPELGDGS